MQSGKRNAKNWVLTFDTLDTGIYPLIVWESSKDTMSEVKLEFSTKEEALNYAKKNNIPVGPGRGSAAGYIVAYSTNITDVDP